MKLFEEELFPVRFLGFGLFWAWLFMVGLSPSPLFGNPLCLGSVPFELFELLMRCAVLTLSLALSRPIATNRGKRLYLAVGAIAGMAVTPLLLWGEGATAHSLAALLAAVADVAEFLRGHETRRYAHAAGYVLRRGSAAVPGHLDRRPGRPRCREHRLPPSVGGVSYALGAAPFPARG